jgi:ATP-binding cassette subfamily B protein
MNAGMDWIGKKLSGHQENLLNCCCYLVKESGATNFAELLEKSLQEIGSDGRKESLEIAIKTARSVGFQALIHRPSTKQFVELAPLLPAIIESRDERYYVLESIDIDPGGQCKTVTYSDIHSDGECNTNSVSLEELFALWTGGILRFEKVNTALICFSIVAREHKLELTQDRLRHEYNLGNEEIPGEILLRMSKDFGLKAKLLHLDWQGLVSLHKAYPAIARLASGRHVVVAGVAGKDGSELSIACYDPLHGTGGGHLRLSRQEFEQIWDGEICVLKRVYKLSDESQPFSLRWFIPEILKQKTAFIDIALAVLFINVIALVTLFFFRSSLIKF